MDIGGFRKTTVWNLGKVGDHWSLRARIESDHWSPEPSSAIIQGWAQRENTRNKKHCTSILINGIERSVGDEMDLISCCAAGGNLTIVVVLVVISLIISALSCAQFAARSILMPAKTAPSTTTSPGGAKHWQLIASTSILKNWRVASSASSAASIARTCQGKL